MIAELFRIARSLMHFQGFMSFRLLGKCFENSSSRYFAGLIHLSRTESLCACNLPRQVAWFFASVRFEGCCFVSDCFLRSLCSVLNYPAQWYWQNQVRFVLVDFMHVLLQRLLLNSTLQGSSYIEEGHFSKKSSLLAPISSI